VKNAGPDLRGLPRLPVDDQDGLSTEQRRRMARVWETLEPMTPDVAAARARFLVRPRFAPRPPVSPRVLVLAFVLLSAAAAAAVHVAARRAAARAETTATSAEPRAPLVAPPVRVTHRSIPPTIDEPVAAVTEPTTTPIPPAVTAPGHESALEATPIQATALAPVPPTPVSPVEPLASSRSSATQAAPSPWIAAAEALRRGDAAGAEHAFDELSTSPDPVTRDEARLARAQILIAQGRFAAVRAELADLAATGATPLVRRRAAEALSSPAQDARP
jgi:hypothetical protein